MAAVVIEFPLFHDAERHKGVSALQDNFIVMEERDWYRDKRTSKRIINLTDAAAKKRLMLAKRKWHHQALEENKGRLLMQHIEHITVYFKPTTLNPSPSHSTTIAIWEKDFGNELLSSGEYSMVH